MELTTENILLIGSILLFVSVLAGKTSYKFGVPTLLLFLGIGMVAGSEGLLRINFDDPSLAQFVGIVALNFILFSGGLDTNWESIRPVIWKGITLSTLGVFFTAGLVGVFVWQITNLSLLEGLLLGSIVSSTDAAAVFSILRSKDIALKSNLRPTLELESGSNDPMAFILTITFLGLITQPDKIEIGDVVFNFAQQMIVGGAMGILMGKLSKIIINEIRLDFEGLYPVLLVALMLFTYSATDFLGGNGFLSVYLCGVLLGNQYIIHKKSTLRFFDGLAWLMQIVLFLTLGLLVFPSHVFPVIGIGLLISIFMIFLARPISVFICLSFFKMKNRERLYISWVGLRGAVPIVFATYPLVANIANAELIFNIVFFITITSVILQGTTLTVVSKWLHVDLPAKLKRRSPLDIELSENVKSELTEVMIPTNSPISGKRLVDLNFPKNALIAMIKRGEKFVTPNGATIIEEGDKLMIIAENEQSLMEVFNKLSLLDQRI
jgi:potassium/hydrogen antiporter